MEYICIADWICCKINRTHMRLIAYDESGNTTAVYCGEVNGNKMSWQEFQRTEILALNCWASGLWFGVYVCLLLTTFWFFQMQHMISEQRERLIKDWIITNHRLKKTDIFWATLSVLFFFCCYMLTTTYRSSKGNYEYKCKNFSMALLKSPESWWSSVKSM